MVLQLENRATIFQLLTWQLWTCGSFRGNYLELQLPVEQVHWLMMRTVLISTGFITWERGKTGEFEINCNYTENFYFLTFVILRLIVFIFYFTVVTIIRLFLIITITRPLFHRMVTTKFILLDISWRRWYYQQLVTVSFAEKTFNSINERLSTTTCGRSHGHTRRNKIIACAVTTNPIVCIATDKWSTIVN